MNPLIWIFMKDTSKLFYHSLWQFCIYSHLYILLSRRVTLFCCIRISIVKWHLKNECKVTTIYFSNQINDDQNQVFNVDEWSKLLEHYNDHILNTRIVWNLYAYEILIFNRVELFFNIKKIVTAATSALLIISLSVYFLYYYKHFSLYFKFKNISKIWRNHHYFIFNFVLSLSANRYKAGQTTQNF